MYPALLCPSPFVHAGDERDELEGAHRPRWLDIVKHTTSAVHCVCWTAGTVSFETPLRAVCS